MIRTKGEAGTGDIVEAVRHLRAMRAQIRRLDSLGPDELMREAKQLGAPLELVTQVAREGQLPVPSLRGRRDRDAGRRRALHGARRRGGVRRKRHLPQRRRAAPRASDRRRDDLLARREEAGRDQHRSRASRCAALPRARVSAEQRFARARLVTIVRASASSRCRAPSPRTRGRSRALGPRRSRCVRPADLDGIDGLVSPGRREHRAARAARALRARGAARRAVRASGRPLLATCAGLILVARR